MPTVLISWLIVSLAQIPGLGRGNGANPNVTSWISGKVETKSGDPVPLATITIQTVADASRADRHTVDTQWPGAVTHVKLDGFFKVAVPGQATFEVCAAVAGKGKQCRNVDVETADLQIVNFTF